MAIVASAFSWVRVRSGAWTRIAQGPLTPFGPIQWLELAPAASGPSMVSITLDGYSAAPPFYTRDTNTYDMTGLGIETSQPIGSYGRAAIVTAYPASPFVEFWVLLNRGCWAHMAVF